MMMPIMMVTNKQAAVEKAAPRWSSLLFQFYGVCKPSVSWCMEISKWPSAWRGWFRVVCFSISLSAVSDGVPSISRANVCHVIVTNAMASWNRVSRILWQHKMVINDKRNDNKTMWGHLSYGGELLVVDVATSHDSFRAARRTFYTCLRKRVYLYLMTTMDPSTSGPKTNHYSVITGRVLKRRDCFSRLKTWTN
jgi:hypothetical protein